MSTESQLYTRTCILESQLVSKNEEISRLKQEIMRVTNLLGDAVSQNSWDGEDISPGLKYKLEPNLNNE